LSEKLKQLVNETQNDYESFVDDTQLYKKGKLVIKNFSGKLAKFMISLSALNFLAISNIGNENLQQIKDHQ
jgi:hypothetical protein